MHSFTSSSSPEAGAAGYRRSAAGLLGVLLVVGLGLEVGARRMMPRLSQIEGRVRAEQAGLPGIRREGGRPAVLMVGNSLLLNGVELERLRRELAGEVAVARFVVERTTGLDWEYGVKRVLNEGAKPDLLLVAMDEAGLAQDRLLGVYGANLLLEAGDVAEAGRVMGVDLTTLSGLYLGHYSQFWATHNNLRNFVTQTVLTRYAELAHELAASPAQRPPEGRGEALRRRLAAMKRTAEGHGVRLGLLLIPTPGRGGAEARRACELAGVELVAPLGEQVLPEELFTDGYHLGPEGARRVTERLAAELRSRAGR